MVARPSLGTIGQERQPLAAICQLGPPEIRTSPPRPTPPSSTAPPFGASRVRKSRLNRQLKKKSTSVTMG